MNEPILSVRGLEVKFVGSGRPVPAVRGIDFDVYANEVLGIVGESGSGKSVTSLAISGLLADTAEVKGSIRMGEIAKRMDTAAADIAAPESSFTKELRHLGKVRPPPNRMLHTVGRMGDQPYT